jgi:predicted nucleic acid-binding protein
LIWIDLVNGVVVDTSALVDWFAGRADHVLENALSDGTVVLPPIVVAEVVSGATRPDQRNALGELLQDITVHDTPLEHWIHVGDLRRELSRRGLSVSTPDAHVAQCALDRDALLLTRDAVFEKMARHTKLRLSPG